MFCFYFFVFFSLFLKNPFITLVFPFVQYKISYLSEGEREKEKGEGGREREERGGEEREGKRRERKRREGKRGEREKEKKRKGEEEEKRRERDSALNPNI